MRQVTITKNVYKYDELPIEIREKILERERQNAAKYMNLDYCLDDWKERLNAIGFKDATIYYSGFYNQGAGAFFEAKCNTETVLNTMIYCEVRKGSNGPPPYRYRYATALDYIDAFGINTSITRTNNHYSHERSGHINCEFNYDIRHESKKMAAVLTAIEEDINDFRISLCQAIYKSLQDEYEYQLSDEVLIENIDANELEFTIDGGIF